MMLGSAVGTKWPTRPRGRDRKIHMSSRRPRLILKVVLRRKRKKEMFRSEVTCDWLIKNIYYKTPRFYFEFTLWDKLRGIDKTNLKL
jgi:hypothetical protein